MPIKQAYIDLFERRKKAYESAIGEIKNRSEWGPLEATNPEIAVFLVVVAAREELAPMRTRKLWKGTSLGKSSLTEMESDLVPWTG